MMPALPVHGRGCATRPLPDILWPPGDDERSPAPRVRGVLEGSPR